MYTKFRVSQANLQAYRNELMERKITAYSNKLIEPGFFPTRKDMFILCNMQAIGTVLESIWWCISSATVHYIVCTLIEGVILGPMFWNGLCRFSTAIWMRHACSDTQKVGGHPKWRRYTVESVSWNLFQRSWLVDDQMLWSRQARLMFGASGQHRWMVSSRANPAGDK